MTTVPAPMLAQRRPTPWRLISAMTVAALLIVGAGIPFVGGGFREVFGIYPHASDADVIAKRTIATAALTKQVAVLGAELRPVLGPDSQILARGTGNDCEKGTASLLFHPPDFYLQCLASSSVVVSFPASQFDADALKLDAAVHAAGWLTNPDGVSMQQLLTSYASRISATPVPTLPAPESGPARAPAPPSGPGDIPEVDYAHLPLPQDPRSGLELAFTDPLDRYHLYGDGYEPQTSWMTAAGLPISHDGVPALIPGGDYAVVISLGDTYENF